LLPAAAGSPVDIDTGEDGSDDEPKISDDMPGPVEP
jgi:hypothetical protein